MDNKKQLDNLINLIRSGELIRFYKSPVWRTLRLEVLNRDHFECQRCKSRGKYSRAVCVHHIEEVKRFPARALDKSNLVSLCDACHNQVHDRMAENAGEAKKRFTNIERW